MSIAALTWDIKIYVLVINSMLPNQTQEGQSFCHSATMSVTGEDIEYLVDAMGDPTLALVKWG